MGKLPQNISESDLRCIIAYMIGYKGISQEELNTIIKEATGK